MAEVEEEFEAALNQYMADWEASLRGKAGDLPEPVRQRMGAALPVGVGPDRHATSAGWDPALHPRGQPDNKGQFADKGGGSADSTAKDAPAKSAPPASTPSSRPTAKQLSGAVKSRTPITNAGNANVAEVLILENGAAGVWKSEQGEDRSLRKCIKGPYWKREIVASKLADLLGMGDLVPPTVQHSDKGRVGSLQAFVSGASEAEKVKFAEKEAGGTGAGMYDGAADLARAAVFDFLTLNTDRHTRNWMLAGVEVDRTPDDAPLDRPDWTMRGDVSKAKVVLIDNGLSFPDRHDQPEHGASVLLHKAIKDELPIPEEVKEWAGKAKEVQKMLYASGVGKVETELAMKRLRMLTDAAEEGKSIADLWAGAGIDVVGTLPAGAKKP